MLLPRSGFPVVHPSLRIILWCVLALTAQVAMDAGLAVFFACVAVAAGVLARERSLRLLRRIRFLLLAITVLFTFFTPGEAALAFLDGLGPTREGLILALEHGARLVSVVLLVAILLELTPPDLLVAGLYPLFAPVGLLGISRERLVLRVLLVLRYSTERSAHGWRQWLEETEAGGLEAELAPVQIMRAGWGAADFLALAGLGGALLAWGLR